MKTAVSRSPGAERVVAPIELLFDLVYVFAIGQLSEHLLGQVDLRTGAETVILALAVFYAWYMTAWGANWLDAEQLPDRNLHIRQTGHCFSCESHSTSLTPDYRRRRFGPRRQSDVSQNSRIASGRESHP